MIEVKDTVWRGRTIVSIGDVIDAMDACQSKEDAQDLMKTLIASAAEVGTTEERVRSNIGYLTGYYDPEKGQRFREWFEVKHPIFGDRTPTPEEALMIGMKLAANRSPLS